MKTIQFRLPQFGRSKFATAETPLINDEFVCGLCFNDDGVRDFVAALAEERECSYCGATSEEPIAAPLCEVIGYIAECIGRHYTDPANNLSWESAEGGYQGETYSTDEVLESVELDFPNDRHDKLRARICAGLPNDLWSDMEPYALSPAERLNFSWDEFCRVVKHERRYFFAQQKSRKDSELSSPSELLRLIFSYAEESGALIQLSKGTKLYRARHQPAPGTHVTAEALGPPPVEFATQTNRMSPPGIVMMYASEDVQTALAETASGPGCYAMAEFVTERNALILDLTRLPPVPSIFTELPDTMEYDPRPRLIFLHHIAREISRPIARDDRVHIEYVPTQVVTEYVRTALTTERGRVDGIRYRSSRVGSETAIVLFADQENLALEAGEKGPLHHLWKDRWLRLGNVANVSVSERDIQVWNRRQGSHLFNNLEFELE